MGFALKLVQPEGEQALEAFLLRIPGWSEERYFAEAPDMAFVEFEDGDLVMHAPVSIRHQQLTQFLALLLRAYVRQKKLGDVLCGPAVLRLRPGLNYEPDIFVIPAGQLDRLEPHCFSGTPSLVVEIASPATRQHDMKTKAVAYRKHGVPEYWVVDPGIKTLFQHLPAADPHAPYNVTPYTQGPVGAEAIPGFWIEAHWLWEDPLPEELSCLEHISGR
ncbi:MAG: Uma2 family endonuclease [Thermoanaerobaculum sp.]